MASDSHTELMEPDCNSQEESDNRNSDPGLLHIVLIFAAGSDINLCLSQLHCPITFGY